MSGIDVLPAVPGGNGMYPVKVENQTPICDISQWTVINDVSSLTQQCTWPDNKSVTISQLRVIKQEQDTETSSNCSGESEMWSAIKTESESCDKIHSSQVLDSSLNNDALLTNIKRENCDYTVMGEILQMNGNRANGSWPTVSVEREPPNTVIKQEPQEEMDMMAVNDTNTSQFNETMTVKVIKEETDDSLKGTDNVSDVSLLNGDHASEGTPPHKQISLKEPNNKKRHKRKKSISKLRVSVPTKRHKKSIENDAKAKQTLNDQVRRIRCWLCKEMLGNKILLNEHLKDCHKNFDEQKHRPNKASFCGSNLKRTSDKEKGTNVNKLLAGRQVKTSLSIQCSKCDRAFVSKGNFVQHREWHLRLGHGEVTMKGMDSVSNVKDPKKLKLPEKKKQKKSTTNAELVQCPMCNKKLRKCSFQRHMKVHSTDPRDHPVECPKCDKRYVDKKDMQNHFARNHTENARIAKYPCSVCSKVYTTRTNLKLHIQGVHMKSFKCTMCDCTFYNNFNLQRHIRSCEKKLHGESSDKISFKCNDCEVSFTTKYCLTKHIQRFHSNETPFKCEFCLKQFKARSNLTMHVKRIHSTGPDMSIRCPKCPRLVSSQAELDIHFSIFRFVCQSCPQHFSRTEDLEQHVEQQHPS